MSLSITRSKIPFVALAFASLLMVAAAPASAAAQVRTKHAVYVVDQSTEETFEATAAPAIPATEFSKEDRTDARTAANGEERMQVKVGDTLTLGFQDFYPIPEPETPVRAEAVKRPATWYWVGAAGAALAAGVAAWFILSSEPESRTTVAVLH